MAGIPNAIKKNKNDKRQVAKFKGFVTYYYLPLHILS
jgi:hypothetical protein